LKALKNIDYKRILITTGFCLLSGILTAVLLDAFEMYQVTLLIVPGFLFGLAMILSNSNLFRDKVQQALTTILLCTICWMVLLFLSTLLIYFPFHPLVGYSIVGFVSAVVTLLIFCIFMKFENIIQTAVAAGASGIFAFVIFYFITDKKVGAAGSLEYLFILWQTFVGFAISIGIKKTTSANKAHMLNIG
jgi:hypothetical protein